jgi:hypothetical protein
VEVLALYDIHGNVDALAHLDALTVPVHWIRGNGEREVAEAVGAADPAPDDLAAVTRRSPPPSSARRGHAGSARCR